MKGVRSQSLGDDLVIVIEERLSPDARLTDDLVALVGESRCVRVIVDVHCCVVEWSCPVLGAILGLERALRPLGIPVCMTDVPEQLRAMLAKTGIGILLPVIALHSEEQERVL